MRRFQRAGHGSGKLDFELNIVPIIDCVTILITFMLASGAFISIGILDVGVSAGGSSLNEKPPEVDLSVELQEGHNLVVTLGGNEARRVKLTPVSGEWNYTGLVQELEAVKTKWPKVETLTLLAAQEIPYQDLVKAMEVARKSHSKVMLGGF